MLSETLIQFSIVAGCAGFGAVIAYFLSGLVMDRKEYRETQRSNQQRPIFLFDDEYLVDASAEGYKLIQERSPHLTEMNALLKMLRPQFPDLQTEITQLIPNTHLRLIALDNPEIFVDLDDIDGVLRVSLGGVNGAHSLTYFDGMAKQAEQRELMLLREVTDRNPQLIWREDIAGRLTWANPAYMHLAETFDQDQKTAKRSWRGTPIFPGLAIPEVDREVLCARQSVMQADRTAEAWFDVTSVASQNGILRFADTANEAVRAELAQKAFMQTLGKTFAELAVGLAIFDRKRRLTMFNPALHDLTTLPIEFLSSMPTLDMVMDRLREVRRIPEPKDYAEWRVKFDALEAAAKEGTFSEVWDLSEGQIFRVTGRPHPDGAIAFLFEDITAEMSLTRKFRTEIETSQAVLDTLDEAIAVFSSSNTLVVMNKAYRKLWRGDVMDIELNYDLRTALRVWKTGCAPNAIWRSIEKFANNPGERDAWSDDIILNDGRHMVCHAEPVAGGMTMIKFVAVRRSMIESKKLMSIDPSIRALRL